MKKQYVITLQPIGVVENEFDESTSREEMRDGQSRILLDPELAPGLKGLIPRDDILVLFYLHRVDDFDLFQHPRGDRDRPPRGLFSLRTPRRPNPIGATVVKILSIHENELVVRGLDAYHATPVLDIKPA